MVGFDIFSTEARVGNMASEVVLDSVTKDLPEVPIAGIPPLLIINVQLPSAPPALMTSAEDGPGYQVCLFFDLAYSSLAILFACEYFWTQVVPRCPTPQSVVYAELVLGVRERSMSQVPDIRVLTIEQVMHLFEPAMGKPIRSKQAASARSQGAYLDT